MLAAPRSEFPGLKLALFNILAGLAMNSPECKSVEIIGNNDPDACLRLLDQNLCNNTNMKFLTLSAMNFESSGFQALVRIFNRNKNISRLKLIQIKFTDRLTQLWKVLSVAELSLKSMHLSQADIVELAQNIRHNTALRSLELKDISIGSQAKHITSAIAISSSLKHLSLENCGIGAQGAVDIGDMLKCNTTLTLLMIQRDKIEVTGVTSLALALCRNTTLTSLTLYKISSASLLPNMSTDEIFQTLGSCLANNNTLTQITLCGDPISSQGCFELINGLCLNRTLHRLDLVDMELKHVKLIGWMLKRNHVLQRLNLAGNHITCQDLIDPHQGTCLLDVLQTNSTLTTLRLSKNKLVDYDISRDTERAVIEGFSRARYLQYLSLDHCQLRHVGGIIGHDSSLIYLDLSHNPMAISQIQDCVDALVHNTTLRNLHLPEIQGELVVPSSLYYNTTLVTLKSNHKVVPQFADITERNNHNAFHKYETLVRLLLRNHNKSQPVKRTLISCS